MHVITTHSHVHAWKRVYAYTFTYTYTQHAHNYAHPYKHMKMGTHMHTFMNTHICWQVMCIYVNTHTYEHECTSICSAHDLGPKEAVTS